MFALSGPCLVEDGLAGIDILELGWRFIPIFIFTDSTAPNKLGKGKGKEGLERSRSKKRCNFCFHRIR